MFTIIEHVHAVLRAQSDLVRAYSRCAHHKECDDQPQLDLAHSQGVDVHSLVHTLQEGLSLSFALALGIWCMT